jgi:arylsulfatase A-like enzyme
VFIRYGYRSPRRKLGLLIAFLVLATILGMVVVGPACRPADTQAGDPVVRGPGEWNVILISMDTLRADRLGCYGYSRDTSPAIDGLARRGVRFARLIAESPWTAPSHMTVFTGLYPTTHGVTTPGTSIASYVPTLPTLLRDRGYRTFAYVGGSHVTKYAGFGRGFERFAYTGLHNGLQPALEMAREQIESFAPTEPYFVFIHAYDVHAPYNPPRPYNKMFRAPNAEPFEGFDRVDIHYRRPGFTLSPGNVAYLSDQYDGSIREADDRLRGFFEFLEKRGEFDRTIVVLLGDHGEEFGEHGWVGHKGTIYPEVLQPPLIITAPSIAPRVVDQHVGLKDVFATILDMLSIDLPPVAGRSLVPLMHGRSLPPEPMFSELDHHGHYRSVIWCGHQLIREAYRTRVRLFDLRTDPWSTRDIAAARPEVVAELMAVMPDPPAEISTRDFQSDEYFEQLQSLGYVGG